MSFFNSLTFEKMACFAKISVSPLSMPAFQRQFVTCENIAYYRSLLSTCTLHNTLGRSVGWSIGRNTCKSSVLMYCYTRTEITTHVTPHPQNKILENLHWPDTCVLTLTGLTVTNR